MLVYVRESITIDVLQEAPPQLRCVINSIKSSCVAQKHPCQGTGVKLDRMEYLKKAATNQRSLAISHQQSANQPIRQDVLLDINILFPAPPHPQVKFA